MKSKTNKKLELTENLNGSNPTKKENVIDETRENATNTLIWIHMNNDGKVEIPELKKQAYVLIPLKNNQSSDIEEKIWTEYVSMVKNDDVEWELLKDVNEVTKFIYSFWVTKPEWIKNIIKTFWLDKLKIKNPISWKLQNMDEEGYVNLSKKDEKGGIYWIYWNNKNKKYIISYYTDMPGPYIVFENK